MIAVSRMNRVVKKSMEDLGNPTEPGVVETPEGRFKVGRRLIDRARSDGPAKQYEFLLEWEKGDPIYLWIRA